MTSSRSDSVQEGNYYRGTLSTFCLGVGIAIVGCTVDMGREGGGGKKLVVQLFGRCCRAAVRENKLTLSW